MSSLLLAVLKRRRTSDRKYYSHFINEEPAAQCHEKKEEKKEGGGGRPSHVTECQWTQELQLEHPHSKISEAICSLEVLSGGVIIQSILANCWTEESNYSNIRIFLECYTFSFAPLST